MLILSKDFSEYSIINSEDKTKIGKLSLPIINKDKLSILAWHIYISNTSVDKQILLSTDIMAVEYGKIIIKSLNKLKKPQKIPSLTKYINENYKLEDSLVFDDNGKKLGVVISYIIDTDSSLVEQIIVRSSAMLYSLSPELAINRKQIISVESNKIIVKSSGVHVFNPDRLFQSSFA